MVEIDRRRFLVAGAVTGTLVWATPTILAIDPASAAQAAKLGSAPPRTTPPVTGPPPIETKTPPPNTVHQPPPVGSLPFTGNEEARDALIGAAVLAGGAALVIGAKENREYDG